MKLVMRALVVTTLLLAGVGAIVHPSPAALPGAGSSGAVPAGPVTPSSWAQALLSRLEVPASPENLRAIVAWEQAEGGHWRNDARFNPLDTTRREPGSWPINAVGVQAYPSWDEGLTATVSTLRNGLYGGIVAALRAGDCAACVAGAVASSPWGTGWFPV